jgi:hypothetical protein
MCMVSACGLRSPVMCVGAYHACARVVAVACTGRRHPCCRGNTRASVACLGKRHNAMMLSLSSFVTAMVLLRKNPCIDVLLVYSCTSQNNVRSTDDSFKSLLFVLLHSVCSLIWLAREFLRRATVWKACLLGFVRFVCSLCF